MTLGLDHVQVAAPPGCEGAARAFYGGLLGLAELPKPEAMRASGGAWFALADGRELHIGVEPGFVAAAKAHPGFLVPASAWDALIGGLAAAGVAFVADERMPGVVRGYVHDPWGNRLELRASSSA